MKPGLDLRDKSAYCILFWNDQEVGRTKARKIQFGLVDRSDSSHGASAAFATLTGGNGKLQSEVGAQSEGNEKPAAPVGRILGTI